MQIDPVGKESIRPIVPWLTCSQELLSTPLTTDQNNPYVARWDSFSREPWVYFSPDWLSPEAAYIALTSITETSTRWPKTSFANVISLRHLHVLAPHLDIDDIRYLESKGALSIPSASLQSELLESYIQFVHPFLPLLDLPQFLRLVQTKSSKISLCLFQTLMFAASTFVNIGALRREGYATRREAKDGFFQKAKVRHNVLL